MAVGKNTVHEPASHKMRPGEDPLDWTVRTANVRREANGYWYIRFTRHQPGAEKKYRTDSVSTRTKDKNEAYRELTIWQRDYARETRAGQAPKAHTFREVMESYILTSSMTRLTRSAENLTRRAGAMLGDEIVTNMTAKRISECHAQMLRDGLRPGTVVNYLRFVKTVLIHGRKMGLIPAGAVPEYRLPPVPPSRRAALSAAEADRVFAAAAAWGDKVGTSAARRAGLFTCLALDTAQRRDAILDLTWERCDLTPGHEKLDFRNPDHQPRNKRRCPGAPVLGRLLAVLRREAGHAPKDSLGSPTGPLFPQRRIVEGFAAFRAHLGLPDLTPHVCRHTWATLASARGVPMSTIAFIMADDIATIARVYDHHETHMARDNLRRWASPPPALSQTRQTHQTHGSAGNVVTEFAD